VPHKNTAPIHGRSLVERAIACAKAVPEIDGQIYVSTDDEVAACQAMKQGVRAIHRPPDLAADDTPMVRVILHAIHDMNPKPDILVLLQPTTPSRTWEMVQDAVQSLKRQPSLDSVVSVVPLPLTHSPEMTMTVQDHRLSFYAKEVPVCRQDARRVYIRDGSVYAMRVSSLRKHGSIYGLNCMPYILRPDESLNIDTQAEWDRAHTLLR
jgi:N-acylneuraminate cytidylyltransferase